MINNNNTTSMTSNISMTTSGQNVIGGGGGINNNNNNNIPTIARQSVSPTSNTSSPTNNNIQNDGKKKNLFVAGLDRSIGDKLLNDLFAKFGEVLSCKVMLDIVTGQSRGFGFVLFADSEAAERAIKSLDAQTIYLKKVF